MTAHFNRIARLVEGYVGSPWASLLAVLIVVVWALAGPLFGWSDTWQLVINTGTTVVTFLMVFLIQSTQTQDTRAMQVKMDELLRAVGGARSSLAGAEDLTQEELRVIKDELVDAARREGC